MTDLVAFLAARLREDEAAAVAAAQAAEGGQWNPTRPSEDLDYIAYRTHIARHDPARVLREVESKRKILEHHSPQAQQIWRDQRVVGEQPPTCGWCSDREEDHPWPCPDVLAIAAVWSDHPDYDPAWAQVRT